MSLAAVQGVNLAARFLIELAALGALAWWGFQLTVPGPMRVVAGFGAPLLAAATWALFASPQAAVALPGPAKLAVQALVLGSAVTALLDAGQTRLAVGFGVAVLINAALLAWWDQ